MITLSNEEAEKFRAVLQWIGNDVLQAIPKLEEPTRDELMRAIHIYQERTGQTLEDTLAGKWTNLPATEPRAMRSADEIARNIVETYWQRIYDQCAKDNGASGLDLFIRAISIALASRPDVAGWKPLCEMIAAGHTLAWVQGVNSHPEALSLMRIDGKPWLLEKHGDKLAIPVIRPAAPSGKGEAP